MATWRVCWGSRGDLADVKGHRRSVVLKRLAFLKLRIEGTASQVTFPGKGRTRRAQLPLGAVKDPSGNGCEGITFNTRGRENQQRGTVSNSTARAAWLAEGSPAHGS